MKVAFKSLFLASAIFSVLLCLTACQGKASFDEVTGKVENNELIIYKGDKRFTGELWSDDNLVCDKVKDGKIVEAIIYHKNGKKAMVTKDGKPEYFDEDGKPMDFNEFADKYFYEVSKSLESVETLTIEK